MIDTPRHWEPLERATKFSRRKEVVEETMRHYGITFEVAAAMLDREEADTLFFVNRLYQVSLNTCGPENDMLHICVRRRDGGAIFDWRHMQEVKNQLAGPEREGFQLFPAESRKVDTSNKYHLFVLPEGARFSGIGWENREVSYDENRDVPGLRQRAL